MSIPFDTVALSGDQVPQALPLVQAAWPSVDLATWQRFVQFFSGRAAMGESGVLALRDPAGYLCGILAYRLDWDLRAGPMLAVDLFAAIDLANSMRTVRALLDAAKARASELGCAGVQVRLCNEQAGLASHLRSLGLSSHAGLFWKKVAGAHTYN